MKQSVEQVKFYDAGDMADAHALAQSHIKWLVAIISTVKQNIECDKTFHNQELLEIAQYLSELFTEDHQVKSEKYDAEYSAQS